MASLGTQDGNPPGFLCQILRRTHQKRTGGLKMAKITSGAFDFSTLGGAHADAGIAAGIAAGGGIVALGIGAIIAAKKLR